MLLRPQAQTNVSLRVESCSFAANQATKLAVEDGHWDQFAGSGGAAYMCTDGPGAWQLDISVSNFTGRCHAQSLHPPQLADAPFAALPQ
jgi:hypothetical protein